MANLNIDIKNEQEKAREEIKKQGFRVLVCAGTGCVANGSLSSPAYQSCHVRRASLLY